jgi:integrase
VKRNGNGRLLSDIEIRSIWQATDKLPPNKRDYWRFLFLTGIRRTSAGRIAPGQLNERGILHIPGSQTKPEYDLPLSQAAATLLKSNFGGRWVFAPLGPFDMLKDALDGHLSQVAPWTIHHIRHTVRSLLGRAGVRPDIARLCVGHSQRGMDKTYRPLRLRAGGTGGHGGPGQALSRHHQVSAPEHGIGPAPQG